VTPSAGAMGDTYPSDATGITSRVLAARYVRCNNGIHIPLHGRSQDLRCRIHSIFTSKFLPFLVIVLNIQATFLN